MSRLDRAILLLPLLVAGCPDEADSPSADASTSSDVDATSSSEGDSTSSSGSDSTSSAGSDDSSSDTGTPGCDGAGKPEMTGPISGLEASYPAGDPIDVGVPVDEDTARVIVGIYEVGSKLYLGGTAEDVAPSSVAQMSFFAGVVNGETGEFYLAIELCSTSICTTPFVRNTYDRADRTIPLVPDEMYMQRRENVGGAAMPETCATTIPIQSFLIQ